MLTRKFSIRERFRCSLSKSLLNSKILPPLYRKYDSRITGEIQTEQFMANIEIHFPSCQFKFVAPTIFCSELWLKNDIHWHCNKLKGSSIHVLCWVHPEEWKKAHRKKSQTKTIEEGSEWLLNNVTDLLEKHWVGTKLGIKYWKKEWLQWLHEEEGIEEFFSEIKSQEIPSNWKT